MTVSTAFVLYQQLKKINTYVRLIYVVYFNRI